MISQVSNSFESLDFAIVVYFSRMYFYYKIIKSDFECLSSINTRKFYNIVDKAESSLTNPTINVKYIS